jgi:SWI/SNF-related matrix-associated actin-dependent regulator 1 of chromatin subfamily A
LASRQAALLADEQRVGKTGSAIMACDYVFARKILVLTKSSARANWGREFREWSFGRKIQVVYKGSDKVDQSAGVVVVGWGMVINKALFIQLRAQRWDVLILDESHEAKNPDAKRTSAVYGARGVSGLAQRASNIWCLSGTPIPNAPNDLWPMLNALAPERLEGRSYEAFMHRYCVVKRKYVGGQWIEYALKGKNEDELRERLEGFWLRRTQQDVGITKPIFSVFTLHADKVPREALELEKAHDFAAILDAAETGSRLSEDDELHLGTLRRLTGEIKAYAVIDAAKEALDDGLDKLVLMAWHQDVIDILRHGLMGYGVCTISGQTLPKIRQNEVDKFQRGKERVFVGQIQAAGEAIDLSASAELWFVEPSFTPKDMSQAAMRITNFNQKRQPLVRFCALEGSIDEAFQAILTRKVSTIRQVLEN